MTSVAAPDIHGLLEKHFGYQTFRPLQEDIIQTVLKGEDALAVMPTGSGKSLCFQIPALCLPGVTLVISPLIALMKDQVDGLRENGIAAAFLNSSQIVPEQIAIQEAAKRGEIKLLYIAPERLPSKGFSSFLSSLHVNLLAIDEAHCISQWGHEFRPDYRNLLTLRETFPHVPCIALTATATPKVQDDIREQLKLQTARTFLSSFNRENLTYHVYPKSKTFERLLVALRKPNRLPAIIYCFSRRDTETLAIDLRAEGFTCQAYHAGLDPYVRRQTQDDFMRDQLQVVTATIAFGMGIDKPDVRTVVHMDLPKSVEGYYQETGRAGRDGLPSDCILFFSQGDAMKHEYFIRQIEDTAQKEMSRRQVQEMVRYGELRSCRRAYLLHYFGEERTTASCNGCDRCLRHHQKEFDATVIVQKILSAVIRLGQRFGAAHVCAVLLGRSTARIRELGHHTLSVFGIVTDFAERQLREIIGSLLEIGFLRKADGQYPTLSVTDAGRNFLRTPTTLMLSEPEEEMEVVERTVAQEDIDFDPRLFEELRTLRRSLADSQGVAAFVIFGDRSLREMAAYLPQSAETFQHIYGVSVRKYEQYGEQFLTIIRSFATLHQLQEKGIARTDATRRRKERRMHDKESTFDKTRQLLEQKLSLAEIARQRNLKESTLIQHIEQLHAARIPLSIDHLKPAPEIFDPIVAAFHKHNGEALTPVFEEFEGRYSYDLLRLVRAILRSTLELPKDK